MARWMQCCRRYLHGEFIGAAFLALLTIAIVWRAVNGGAPVGAVIFVVAASTLIWVLWRSGTGRWLDVENRLVWASTNARRVLMAARLAFVESGGAGFASFLIEGNRKRGLLIILLAETWSSSKRAEVGALLREAKQQSGADDVVLWLPFTNLVGWRIWLWPHARGIKVVRFGPWKLRSLIKRWRKARFGITLPIRRPRKWF